MFLMSALTDPWKHRRRLGDRMGLIRECADGHEWQSDERAQASQLKDQYHMSLASVVGIGYGSDRSPESVCEAL